MLFYIIAFFVLIEVVPRLVPFVPPSVIRFAAACFLARVVQKSRVSSHLDKKQLVESQGLAQLYIDNSHSLSAQLDTTSRELLKQVKKTETLEQQCTEARSAQFQAEHQVTFMAQRQIAALDRRHTRPLTPPAKPVIVYAPPMTAQPPAALQYGAGYQELQMPVSNVAIVETAGHQQFATDRYATLPQLGFSAPATAPSTMPMSLINTEVQDHPMSFDNRDASSQALAIPQQLAP